MELRVEEWPIDRLVPYARNPRKNDDAVDRMVASLKEFGFRIPVVARSDGTVVDGHLRLKGARKLGLKTVPVALADELTDAQIRAFRLLANRSATWASWDDELLRLELDDLEGMGFDLELTGFSREEIADLEGGLGAGGDAGDGFPGESWAVVVECGSEAEQVALIRRLQAEGLTVRASIG